MIKIFKKLKTPFSEPFWPFFTIQNFSQKIQLAVKHNSTCAINTMLSFWRTERTDELTNNPCPYSLSSYSWGSNNMYPHNPVTNCTTCSFEHTNNSDKSMISQIYFYNLKKILSYLLPTIRRKSLNVLPIPSSNDR